MNISDTNLNNIAIKAMTEEVNERDIDMDEAHIHHNSNQRIDFDDGPINLVLRDINETQNQNFDEYERDSNQLMPIIIDDCELSPYFHYWVKTENISSPEKTSGSSTHEIHEIIIPSIKLEPEEIQISSNDFTQTWADEHMNQSSQSNSLSPVSIISIPSGFKSEFMPSNVKTFTTKDGAKFPELIPKVRKDTRILLKHNEKFLSSIFDAIEKANVAQVKEILRDTDLIVFAYNYSHIINFQYAHETEIYHSYYKTHHPLIYACFELFLNGDNHKRHDFEEIIITFLKQRKVEQMSLKWQINTNDGSIILSTLFNLIENEFKQSVGYRKVLRAILSYNKEDYIIFNVEKTLEEMLQTFKNHPLIKVTEILKVEHSSNALKENWTPLKDDQKRKSKSVYDVILDKNEDHENVSANKNEVKSRSKITSYAIIKGLCAINEFNIELRPTLDMLLIENDFETVFQLLHEVDFELKLIPNKASIKRWTQIKAEENKIKYEKLFVLPENKYLFTSFSLIMKKLLKEMMGVKDNKESINMICNKREVIQLEDFLNLMLRKLPNTKTYEYEIEMTSSIVVHMQTIIPNRPALEYWIAGRIFVMFVLRNIWRRNIPSNVSKIKKSYAFKELYDELMNNTSKYKATNDRKKALGSNTESIIEKATSIWETAANMMLSKIIDTNDYVQATSKFYSDFLDIESPPRLSVKDIHQNHTFVQMYLIRNLFLFE